MRPTATARSRLWSSAVAISAVRRGSRKYSRHPMAAARAPAVPPGVSDASYSGGVGSGGWACGGAKWHAESAARASVAAMRRWGDAEVQIPRLAALARDDRVLAVLARDDTLR